MTRAKKEKRGLGKLPPQYTFILNPYVDARFTRCPGCDKPTKLRKLPLLIHVDLDSLIALNKTCRYCPHCDLLIAHQDELEAQLGRVLPGRAFSGHGKDYLVLGTVERPAWRQGVKMPMTTAELFGQLHDFKEVRIVTVERGGWYRADEGAAPAGR